MPKATSSSCGPMRFPTSHIGCVPSGWCLPSGASTLTLGRNGGKGGPEKRFPASAVSLDLPFLHDLAQEVVDGLAHAARSFALFACLRTVQSIELHPASYRWVSPRRP